jgi:dihydropyrimidine dehydrogenase (NAD+) subunit PreT
MGYAATVIDARGRAGGLNTYGVAEYKLRASDSEREIEMIRGLGVEFRLGVEVGVAVSVEDLETEFDLIFVGAGLGPTQPLGIPGETLPGVVDALHFIADYKTKPGARVGGRVAVIGGGNTAIDAAVAARRLGAQEVHLVYRRTEKEMPAFRFEVERARREGVRFHFQAQPVAVTGHAAVELLECAPVELGSADRTGRREPTVMAGAHFWIECDMVIPSIGQSRLVELLRQCRGIEVESGMVQVAAETGETANPRYYAGGDCVNGGREVVDAVADGKRAARAMGLKLERLHG